MELPILSVNYATVTSPIWYPRMMSAAAGALY